MLTEIALWLTAIVLAFAALLILVGILWFGGAWQNIGMLKQDPSPSKEDREATGKLMIAGFVCLGAGLLVSGFGLFIRTLLI